VDLNHRPLGYEPNELPDCSTPQFDHKQCPRHRQTGEPSGGGHGDVPEEVAIRTASFHYIDAIARTLASIPYGDDPLCQEEAREIEAAEGSLARGEGIPHEKALAEFGLTSKLPKASSA
jgi:hypothetical protein